MKAPNLLIIACLLLAALPGLCMTPALPDTTIYIYRMTCFPDSVGCDTLIVGTDTTVTVTSLAGPISPEGLVAYFPMGVGFGNDSVARDMSGFGNDGTIYSDMIGVQYFPDRCEIGTGAMKFSENRVVIPHKDYYYAPSMTFSIWFRKENDTIDCYDKIIEKGGYGNRSFSLEIKSHDTSTACGGQGTAPWDIQMNSSTINLGDFDSLHVNSVVYAEQWHLVAGTLEQIGDSTIQRLYFDNVLIDSNLVPGQTQYNDSAILIGATPGNYVNDFDGRIDEFRLYTRTLSQDEIEKLWLDGCTFCTDIITHNTTCDPSLVSTSPVVDSMRTDTLYQTVTSYRLPYDISHEGLVAYFPFGEGFGDNLTAIDMSGFGNHGSTTLGMGMTEFTTDNCLNETGALHFEGDRLDVPHSNFYNTADYSFSIWFKKNDGEVPIVDKILEKGEWYERPMNLEVNTHTLIDNGSTAPAPWNLQMNVITCTQENCGNGTSTYDLRLVDSIFAEQWYFMAGIVDYNEETDTSHQLLYFNGVRAKSFKLLGRAQHNNISLSIGNAKGTTSYDFDGDMDEFRLYNRALSPEEVFQLYQFKPCPQSQSLTLCYGDTITLKNGTYSAQGNYLDTMLTDVGCDSLEVSLRILPFAASHMDTSVCSNELLFFHGDTIPGEVDSLPVILEGMGYNGCDSTIFVTRYNLPIIQLARNDSLCWEDTLIVNNHLYHRLNPSGMETMPRFGTSCDSTIIVDLTFRQRALSFHHLKLCENSDTLLFDEVYSCSEDTLTFFLEGAGFHGCDSTVKILLSCAPIYSLQIDTVLFHTNTLRVVDSTYRFPYTSTSSGVHHALTWEGCDSLISVSIQWKIQQEERFPEAITPNGDGINDTFVVPPLLNASADFPSCQLFIHDRYGREHWRSAKPYQNDWNGVDSGGEPLPAGTYIWVFHPDEKPSNALRGNVTIIR